jgi:hypothetical protein
MRRSQARAAAVSETRAADVGTEGWLTEPMHCLQVCGDVMGRLGMAAEGARLDGQRTPAPVARVAPGECVWCDHPG